MIAEQELQELANDPSIVISIEIVGPGRWLAHLGDRAHGYITRGKLTTFDDAVSWLQFKAWEYYPQSQYVQQARTALMVASQQSLRLPFLHSLVRAPGSVIDPAPEL